MFPRLVRKEPSRQIDGTVRPCRIDGKPPAIAEHDLDFRTVLVASEKAADLPLHFGRDPLSSIGIASHPEEQPAVLSDGNDDPRINLEWHSEPFPVSVQRGVHAVAVLPVPMVVDVEVGVAQATIEVVVARVVDVRLPFTKPPIPNLLLSHRLVEPEQDATIAIFVLQEPGLRVEVLTGLPILE